MANADRDDMKRKNRGMVLRLVATGQCRSRIELSKSMGLTKTAISKIVTELIDRGYLKETVKQDNAGMGRNPIGLDIADTAPLFIGLLVLRDFCEAVLCNMKLDILKHRRMYDSWRSADELVTCLYRLTDEMLDGEENVQGIGVALTGPIDNIEGIIQNPPYFKGVHDVPVVRLLKERYQLPVYCDNDNQSAVLAEKLFGNGRDYNDILLVGISNGVGSGIIIGGERYQSSSGNTPEFGHVCIDYNGPTCVCGNKGCVEMYLSSTQVLKRLKQITGEWFSYREFCEMADRPEVAEIFEDQVEKLSAALVSVVNLLNPELIIIGNYGAWWPQKYLNLLEERVNSRRFSSRAAQTKVVRAYYLDQTAVLGGVCDVLIRYFDGELL